MGHVIARSEFRWPNGVIPYTINEQDFPPGDPELTQIDAAVFAWNNSTNIELRRRQPGDAGNSYVEFVAGDDSTSCHTSVGRQHGLFERPVRQAIYCNLRAGTLTHEIGHAVGLYHEHQRDDRHWHVTILYENVIEAKRHDFDKMGDAGDDIGPYDSESVMHYFDETFAVDWLNGATIPLQRSSFRPALAAFNNELHMVHLGVSPSNDLWHAKWTRAGGWTNDVLIEDQKSWTTPALAVFNNELHMVHSGSSVRDELWHASFPAGGALGQGWRRNVEIKDQKSWTTPALAAFNDELHMVHSGSSHPDQLWHTSFPAGGALGRGWRRNVEIKDQESRATPALAVFSNELHMVHLGSSGSDQLWHAIFPAGAGLGRPGLPTTKLTAREVEQCRHCANSAEYCTLRMSAAPPQQCGTRHSTELSGG